jgi:hypothetical protein
MATQAKVIIKGQNDIGKAVKSAASDLGSLKDSAAKLSSMLKTAFSVTAVIATVQKLGAAVSDCFSNYAAAERSYRQLAYAIGDTEAYDKLVGTIDDLSRQTLQEKDDIESMVAELAALGKSSEEIDKISSASVYLSNVTGKDLNSSMTTLLGTYNGTTTQIKKLGINVAGLTKEQLASGAAVDEVIRSLGAYSKAMAEMDTSQHLTNIKNTWGDIKQAVGGVLDYNFGPFIANFDTFLSDSYTNISGIINYVGAVIANLPEVGRLALDTLWGMIKKTFEWESIKTIFTVAIENIYVLAEAAVKAFFITIPKALDAIGTGIIAWIGYIGTSIRDAISSAVSDAFSIGWLEAIQNPISKMIIGDQEITFKGKTQAFNEFSHKDQNEFIDIVKKGTATAFAAVTSPGFANNPEGTAKTWARAFGLVSKEEQKAAADNAFEGLSDIFVESFEDVVSTVKTVGTTTGKALESVYGDSVEGFAEALNKIVVPELELISHKSEASDQLSILTGGSSGGTGGDDGGGEEEPAKVLTWVQVFTDFKDAFTSITDVVSSDAGIFSSLGQSIGSLVSAVRPLMEMIFSSNPIIAILVKIFEGFAEVMAPALSTVIAPLMDALKWIGQSLAGVFLPILDAIYPIMQIIGAILTTVFAPIFQLLSPVIELVALVFTALTPIVALLGKVFTILMSPIEYVADLFSWLGDWLEYMGDCVAICAWNLTHWFDQKSYGASPGSFSSDAFSGLEARLAQWDSFALNDSAASDSVSTGTAVSSASYQGATQVTINIYQQAPVVGDGGMRAFARMIRNEFDELAYLGVTS